jgi:hypothetical protein
LFEFWLPFLQWMAYFLRQKMKRAMELSMLKHITSELIATPSRCFVLALMLIMLAGGLASPFTVVRDKRDASGRTILDSEGTPIVEVDRFANFAAHWPENVCFMSGLAIGILGFAKWVSRLNNHHCNIGTEK